MSYADLSYYAYGEAPVAAKVATFVRERGLAGLAQAVTAAVAATNIAGMEKWIRDNPLPSNASADTRQTRALVIAAVAKAKARATATDLAVAQRTFEQARQQYQRFAAAQYQKEKPSGLALWLNNIGLDLSSAVTKVALVGGLAVGGYLLLPTLLRRGK